MKGRLERSAAVVVATCVLGACPRKPEKRPATTPDAAISSASAADAGPSADADGDRGLALAQFRPRSMLRVSETKVERAKFPVIDVHNHTNDGKYGSTIETEKLVARMDALNIRTIVILTGGWGERLDNVLARTAAHRDRFIVFTQVDWSQIDRPDFGKWAAGRIADAVKRGARGLKVLKQLGLGVRGKDGELVAVDDERLDPIWAECGRLKIPVAIHTSDPDAFFLPADATNERIEELAAHPDWHFPVPRFPSKDSLLAARDRVIARHPKTTFIALHVANRPENLDYVTKLLDEHPNVLVEFGARQAELGRQPRRARRFFARFADRILFGSDFSFAEAGYRNYFRWLETEDEYFDYYGAPEQGRWKIYGLALPDKILQKVYNQNAARLFATRAK